MDPRLIIAYVFGAMAALVFIFAAVYLYGLPSRLRVHAPLCDGPRRCWPLRWLF